MSLTPQQIELLPPEQKAQVLALQQQLVSYLDQPFLFFYFSVERFTWKFEQMVSYGIR